MKIIKPGFLIEERDEQRGGLAIIEKAARNCYKTEDSITADSAESMVKALIRRKHDAMLEHGDYIFLLDDYHILDNVSNAARVFRLTLTNIGGKRPIISGNIRAWRELIASGSGVAFYFTGKIDPVFTEDLIPEAERIDDPRVTPITYADLQGAVEQRVHLRQTVRFIIDRGVSHEFVRHRNFSFAQESTRYCNYGADKFGREIRVIEPCYLEKGSDGYSLWKRACMSAETAYFQLLNFGLQPQEARAVLPTSTKTELIMTGTLGDWQHFFDLRALDKTGKAHPQAREVAKPLLIEMAKRFPDVIHID